MHSETTGRCYIPVLESSAVNSNIETGEGKVDGGHVQGPATDGSNDGAVSKLVDSFTGCFVKEQ